MLDVDKFNEICDSAQTKKPKNHKSYQLDQVKTQIQALIIKGYSHNDICKYLAAAGLDINRGYLSSWCKRNEVVSKARFERMENPIKVEFKGKEKSDRVTNDPFPKPRRAGGTI